MEITIPEHLLQRLEHACQGYDIPTTKEEIAQLIIDLVGEWVDKG